MRSSIAGVAVALLVGCATPEPDAFAAGEAAYAARDYATAKQHYQAALAKAAGPAPQVRARLGLTLRKLGEMDAAVRTLNQAIAEAEQAGDGHTAARARRFLARGLDDTGQHQQAMALFDQALEWHTKHGPLDDLLRVQMMRAGSAWRQGDFEGAYDAYQDVHDRAVVAGQVDVQAGGLEGMALLLGYAGQLADARQALAQAQLLYRKSGRTDALANALANEAAFALNQGQAKDAHRLAVRALALAQEAQVPITAAQAQVVIGWAHLEQDQWALSAKAAADAEAAAAPAKLQSLVQEAQLVALRAALELAKADFSSRLEALAAVTRKDIALPVLAIRARAALRSGDTVAAIQALDQAIAGYEATRAQLDLDLSRFFTQSRVWAYEARIDLAAKAADLPTLTRLIGQVKARRFAELISGGAAREQDRADRAQAVLAVRKRTAPQVTGALPADLGVIEYYTLPDRAWAIWRAGSSAQVIPLSVRRAELEKEVAALLESARVGGAVEAPAARLAEHLLAPLAEVVRAAAPKRLVVIPHGPLHPLPFEMLPWGGGLLVDALPVFSAPNLAALTALLQRPAPGVVKTALAVGDPEGDLPGAQQEARAVRARFGGSTLIGPQATEGAVRQALAGAAGDHLVHFAVHGVRPAEDTPAYLALNADAKHDGQLEAHEIAERPVNARLVLLSVCNSGRGKANRGDEVVGVLDRAFLEAGVPAVVASRWPVHDAASVLFTQQLYQRLERGVPLLQAFHGAQLALRSGEVKPSDLGPALAQLDLMGERGVRERKARPPEDFTHPYFWATFSLRGDPR